MIPFQARRTGLIKPEAAAQVEELRVEAVLVFAEEGSLGDIHLPNSPQRRLHFQDFPWSLPDFLGKGGSGLEKLGSFGIGLNRIGILLVTPNSLDLYQMKTQTMQCGRRPAKERCGSRPWSDLAQSSHFLSLASDPQR